MAPPIVHDVLSSPGQPLDPATRSFMEPRFSHDFSGVRVHTDGRAAASAREVSANAYTVGPNIVFGAGQFAPGTHEGRRLIAHELTHVVQQIGAERVRGGQSNGNGGLSPINVLGSRGSEAVIQRDEVTESEEERRRKATFGDLPLISPEVAASWGMPSPPPSAVRKEISTSHTSPPGLGPKPGPRTPEDVIAASNVHPHGGHIKPTKKPVPLVPGWHKVVDENGVILGYLHLLVGVTRVLDADGKYVGGDELGLERPFIDPIDIFAGGIGGVVRGSLRGALSALARRAAPRIRVAGFLASQGLRSTVPVLAGDFAPSAFVMAETLAAESVPSAVRGVSGTAVRGAVSQGRICIGDRGYEYQRSDCSGVPGCGHGSPGLQPWCASGGRGGGCNRRIERDGTTDGSTTCPRLRGRTNDGIPALFTEGRLGIHPGTQRVTRALRHWLKL